MKACFLLALCLAVVSALPANHNRISGGSVVNISHYPFIVSMMYSWNLVSYSQVCAGTIISRTGILSAYHCYNGITANRWQVRAGSPNANSGGKVFYVRYIKGHDDFDSLTLDSDIAVVRTNIDIDFVPGIIAPAPIAGANYNLADNQVVFTAGWGSISPRGGRSEQLRHVQIWTVNQTICAQRYNQTNRVVTDNMVCAGWLNVGGRDHCQGDDGGPLVHNGVLVGVTSWRMSNSQMWPGVYTRVSRYVAWIQGAAQ